jgi:hypothetical protein
VFDGRRVFVTIGVLSSLFQGDNVLLEAVRASGLQGRAALEALAEENHLGERPRYVFHGSPRLDLPYLKPHQPHMILEDGRQVADGAPAVVTYTVPATAIFCGLTKPLNGRKAFRQGRDLTVSYYLLQAAADQLARERRVCKVYVMDAEGVPAEVLVPVGREPQQWRFLDDVTPITDYEVSTEECPPFKVIQSDAELPPL